MDINAVGFRGTVPARIMNRQRYRTLASTIIALVVLMAIAETVCFLAVSMHQAEEDKLRTQNRSTRQLLQSLVDAETGLRGFVIARKPQFLEPYYSGVRAIDSLRPESLLELDSGATPADWNVHPFGNTLHRLVDLWATEVDEVSGAKEHAAPADRSVTDGKRLMDSLRLQIKASMDARDARIAKLDGRMSSERTASLVLILFGTVTAIAAVSYAFDRSIRDAVRRDRAVQVASEASRRTRLLSSMAEMLQSAVDRDDANEVLRSSATQLLPGVAGALYVFNNSRDRLDLSTEWPERDEGDRLSRVTPLHIAPSGC